MITKKRSATVLRDSTNISHQKSSKLRKIVPNVISRPSYVKPFWTEKSNAAYYSQRLPTLKPNADMEKIPFQYKLVNRALNKVKSQDFSIMMPYVHAPCGGDGRQKN